MSLNRLEAAINERLANGQKPTDEMRYLAGLTRVQYVFFIPKAKDIVIAGPAEGWAPDPVGPLCGIPTGRPVVELQDLIVALRAFPPGGERRRLSAARSIRRKEGLASDAAITFARIGPSASTARARGFIRRRSGTSLGLQDGERQRRAADTRISPRCWSRPTIA